MNDDAANARWDLRPVQLLREGWAFIKPHYWLVVGVTAVVGLLDGVLMRAATLGPPGLFLLHCTYNSGMLWALLQAYQNKPINIPTLLEPMSQKPGEILALHLIAAALIATGLVLGFFPGFYLAVVFEMSLPLVILNDMRPLDALAKSRRLVHRQLGDFVLFTLALVVINAVGALFGGVGLLLSVPATAGACTLLVAQVFGIHRPNSFVDARLR